MRFQPSVQGEGGGGGDRSETVLGVFEKIQNFNLFKKNTQNWFAYNSVTKYCSEAVLYSKPMAWYPLSPHIKIIDVAFLQDE